MDAFQRAEQNAAANEVSDKIATITEAAKVIEAKAKVLADIHGRWQQLQAAGTYDAADIQKLAEQLNVQKLKALVTAARDYLL